MGYRTIKKLLSSEQLIKALPLSEAHKRKVIQDRKEICDILSGRDERLLVIIGPCSAWPESAVLTYAKRLADLHEQVKHALKIVMRVYVQKPRTRGGWKGLLNQPDPFTKADVEKGMACARKLMLSVLDMGVPIADEALFIHPTKGFMDLLSWVAIGARSSENQEHRIFASAVDCPVGLKNPTHGHLSTAVNSIAAAQYAHIAVFDEQVVETSGNPYAHLVLRGGNGQPNYDHSCLWTVKKQMQKYQLNHPSVIIDVSHENCLMTDKKDYRLQPKIIQKVVDNLDSEPDLKSLVKGFMVESFLKPGHQNIEALADPASVDLGGLSITDPCLGWATTEPLLLDLANRIAPRLTHIS